VVQKAKEKNDRAGYHRTGSKNDYLVRKGTKTIRKTYSTQNVLETGHERSPRRTRKKKGLRAGWKKRNLDRSQQDSARKAKKEQSAKGGRRRVKNVKQKTGRATPTEGKKKDASDQGEVSSQRSGFRPSIKPGK